MNDTGYTDECAGGVNERKREDSFEKCGNCSIGFES